MDRARKIFLAGAVAFLLCLSYTGLANADLMQAGGFENPSLSGSWGLFNSSSVTGWDSPNLLEFQKSTLYGPAAEGSQYMELDSNRGDGNQFVTQTFSTSIGARYTLRFAFSPRPGHGENILEVGIGGLGDFSLLQGIMAQGSGVGLRQTAWTYYTLDFVATGSQTRIGFRDAGRDDSLGTLLDDVSVSGGAASAPEPATLLLVAGPLAGLAAWRRRRQKAARA
ncbi:MAG: DUF642 domain-containing protein [Proteobacteria bacterium]|nr:DUF642 domain-containing protein [Pseudomonadota bacterium]MBU2517601.1 DUF642 domain-containing protein [Pseudomonadota bacterium]